LLVQVNVQEITADLRRQEIEILTEQRLAKIIEGNPKPTTYIGFEPSGPFHIGHFAATIPVIKLAKAGFHAIILLADLHALANDKGELKEIHETAKAEKEMLEHVVEKMGASGKLDYKLGTDFENQSYFIQVLRLSRIVNFTEAAKSMDEISRSSVAKMTSSAIYPLMQAVDIGVLGVDVAVGASQQRKVHVLAIENLKKLGYKTPVALHTQVLLGTDGKNAMSKTKQNTIDLNETQESLDKKIRKTFCAPGDIETNPILDWYKKLLFPLSEAPLEFGGKELASYKDLESSWSRNDISPQQLKKSAKRDFEKLLF
jgi:tyrosyl-tRNA synthetase